jgi:hypothetical protein
VQISATTKPRTEVIREREGGRRQQASGERQARSEGIRSGVVLHCVVEDGGTARTIMGAWETKGCKGPSKQRKLPPAVHALINRLIHGSGPGRLGRGRGWYARG